VDYVGRTSLVIGIKVIAENVKAGLVKHTNTSYFTMVAKGDDDKPAEVPSLILETKTEVKKFIEAIKRKELKRVQQNRMEEIKSEMNIETVNDLLKHERCILAIHD
ncbi:MAG TPA: acyl-CoA thioesterase, partial [Cyclobacteriaceae bacterium]|nr:acyl-CoA thioesterase [Cyclobacteriaceae bacterium]